MSEASELQIQRLVANALERISDAHELSPSVGYVNGDSRPILMISTGKDSVFFDPAALPDLIRRLNEHQTVFDHLSELDNLDAVRQALAEAGL